MLHGEESKMDFQVDLVGKADGEGRLCGQDRDGDVKKSCRLTNKWHKVNIQVDLMVEAEDE